MYVCKDCGHEFDRPEIFKETHGLLSPPYETICTCPRCKSTNFRKAKTKYCHCCGARLNKQNVKYCSATCEKAGEKLRAKEIINKKRLTQSPLFTLVREIDSYNALHRTKFSYGQYVAIVKGKRKGGKKV